MIEGEPLVSKRLVVKIGSSTMTRDGNPFNRDFMDSIAGQASELFFRGTDVAIVCSGAVMGGEKIVRSSGTKLRNTQDVAIIGQHELITQWRAAFCAYSIQHVPQILLTDESLEQNKPVLQDALRHGIPIINGHPLNKRLANCANNDYLAGWTARAVGADTLLLLTDTEGVLDYSKGSHDLISYIDRLDIEIEEMIRGDKGSGTGGMWSKCIVARDAAHNGIHAIIGKGTTKDVILRAAEGKPVGTLFIREYANY